MKLILLSITLLLAATANAQKLLVANCTEGGGCTFTLSDISPQEAAIVLDDASLAGAGNNDILVMARKKSGKELTYLEKSKTRSQLDRQWGGDGYTMIYPFNPTLQPLDGQWTSVVGAVAGNECYGNSLSAFRSISGSKSGGKVVFKKPFSSR